MPRRDEPEFQRHQTGVLTTARLTMTPCKSGVSPLLFIFCSAFPSSCINNPRYEASGEGGGMSGELVLSLPGGYCWHALIMDGLSLMIEGKGGERKDFFDRCPAEGGHLELVYGQGRSIIVPVGHTPLADGDGITIVRVVPGRLHLLDATLASSDG